MTAFLIAHALQLLATLGVGAALTKLILAHLPVIQAHTKSAALNKIIDTAGTAAEDIVRALLSAADLDALLSALAGGTPLNKALEGLLPQLVGALRQAIGPTLSAALSKLLGGDEAANSRLSSVIQSAVHELVVARQNAVANEPPQPGQIARLADGHLLVVPHGQALPANATLVGTNGAPAKAA